MWCFWWWVPSLICVSSGAYSKFWVRKSGTRLWKDDRICLLFTHISKDHYRVTSNKADTFTHCQYQISQMWSKVLRKNKVLSKININIKLKFEIEPKFLIMILRLDYRYFLKKIILKNELTGCRWVKLFRIFLFTGTLTFLC